MTKDNALMLFYKNNGIDPKAIHPCDRIADLSQTVDTWLLNISPLDRPVFLEALSRYTYLTQDQCKNRFIELIQMLEQDLAINDIKLNEVLYITIESSGGINSGGDNVRADMHFYNYNKIDAEQIIASQEKLSEEKLKFIKAIVFVDDMIGTGKTIWGSLDSLCSKYGFKGNGTPKLYYMCLSPTHRAIKHLNRNFKKYKYTVTPIYKNEWISHKAYKKGTKEYSTVDKYEEIIDRYFSDPDKTYRMGFEKSCVLISFYYNTPNNTISCFWLPTDLNKPPFTRQAKECKRPGICDLKQKKNMSKANSYSFAIIRKENGI